MGELGSAVLAVSPHSFLCTLSPFAAGVRCGEEQEVPWLCIGAFQWYLKYPWVANAVPSSTLATVKKINTTLAQTSTELLRDKMDFHSTWYLIFLMWWNTTLLFSSCPTVFIHWPEEFGSKKECKVIQLVRQRCRYYYPFRNGLIVWLILKK